MTVAKQPSTELWWGMQVVAVRPGTHQPACLLPQVKSTKMNRTIVVRRDYLHYIKKYQR